MPAVLEIWDDEDNLLFDMTEPVDPGGDVRFEFHADFDVLPGHIVEVSQGSALSEHTVVDVAVTSVDVAADVVEGTGPVGEAIDVVVWEGDVVGPDPPTRHEAADASGDWDADFFVAQGGELPFDIEFGDGIMATVPPDASGNRTQWDEDVVNHAPDAVDDPSGATAGCCVTDEDTVLVENGVLDNDSDPDGYALTVTEINGVALEADTELAKLTASDAAADDRFGYRLAFSDGTLVVGVPTNTSSSDPGAAYVFVRSGTTWTEQATLTASDGAAGDIFGQTVAISGDTIIVGSLVDAGGTAVDKGSAYVFARSGTTWTEQAKLTASDGVAGDLFGVSVAIEGDTAVVGASRADPGGNVDQGAAYVFVRSGSTWTQQAKLTASDGVAGDVFGPTVAISGDTAVVGAREDDSSKGAAYVFVRFGSVWSQQAKLVASDGGANQRFGNAVSISGDTVLVGAYRARISGTLTGAAYAFTRSGTTWTQQAKLVAAASEVASDFGIAVSLDRDHAVVGARHFGSDNEGAAFVFSRSGATWTQDRKLTAPAPSLNDAFGEGVVISGSNVFVGDPHDDDDGTDSGSVYAFGSQLTLPSGATLTMNPDGTFVYDPNGQFDALNDGESTTDTFTYAASDGKLSAGAATVTITINGLGSPG